jgi:hypothetical protein
MPLSPVTPELLQFVATSSVGLYFLVIASIWLFAWLVRR